MARKKEQPKPLFAVKHDFYASLDAFAHQGIMLLQAVEGALKLGCIDAKMEPTLREQMAAFRAALVTDECPEE